MWKRWKQWEAASFCRVWRRPSAGKLEGATWRVFWLTALCTLLWRILPVWLSWLPAIFAWIFGPILFICAWCVLIRWVLARVLWTVRSRIVVTSLLMGLAPVVLFTSLAAIAMYVFCGQFATIAALERIKDSSQSLQQRSHDALTRVQHEAVRPTATGWSGDTGADPGDGLFAIAWRDGHLLPAATLDTRVQPFTGDLPSWVSPGFAGMVGAGGDLYLCGASGLSSAGHAWTTAVCTPFGHAEIARLGDTLGHVSITPDLRSHTLPSAKPHKPNPDGDVDTGDDDSTGKRRFVWVQGGALPAGANLLDIPVYYTAEAPTRVWASGEQLDTFLNVRSRPTALYKLLFSNSLTSGRTVRIILISVAAFFGLLELMAVGLAAIVSGTITRSVNDLSLATREIDRGNLDHRIPVRRKDQLSALAGSFNGMTASLKSLLEEQREKERMLSELMIAQEVQKNLFPHTTITVPDVEVYGICEPARTIGGDYYDFIPFGGTQLYLSLGDISGKGISAALLMASLHSAVRAYQAGESDQPRDFDASLTPGKLLGLLNRHLFTSTQPAKYATLFLASYDAATRRLTYANGGHPPPLLIRADGTVQRLECGGSVVGLLEGMAYDEQTVQLNPGDLLVAYSDGLSEPERKGVEFGEEGVLSVVRRNRILGLQEIAAMTFTAVRQWFGEEEQPDDMTMVLVRVGGASTRS